MSDNNKKQNVFVRFFTTIGRWARRMFMGASKDLVTDINEVENLESPGKLAAKAFFSRPLAVIALIVLIAMFLFVFIGPLIWPMNLNYTDSLQANMAPNMSLMKVPNKLKNNVKDINGFSSFTVGVSNDGELFVWGFTKNSLTKVNYENIPEEVSNNKVTAAAAGSDFIIAVTESGKVVGWGSNTRAQYGAVQAESGLLPMSSELVNGTIDASKVNDLTCGYQATALVVDGKLYMWGNLNACLNMADINDLGLTGVKKVALSNYYAVVLKENGKIEDGGIFYQQSAVSNKSDKKIKNFTSYIATKKVVDIAATDTCFAFLLESGEILVAGASKYGEDIIVEIPEGEKAIAIKGGTRHFGVLTDGGNVYLWGDNMNNQTKLSGKSASNFFLGSKQTYFTNEDNEITSKCGHRGYLMGTDNRGRDTFVRLVHGGKMTMTIGAVAVIVSTIIAIIVGCLSGYFGGWVDMLLMRITEIFSSLPFLPFAMMLSYVIRFMDIDETMRIFIIMVMLGLLSWTGLARMIRAQVLTVRESEYVTAAKAMGVKESKIAFKHILINVISVILVSVTLDFAGCMLTESSLSYLGFGVQQPQPTWGNMLDGANNSIVIQNYWWQWVFPSVFLAIATISINIIGDTLRDVMDPKSSAEK